MKITFIVYDNDSAVNDFPLGIGYLISSLRDSGFPDDDIHVYNMDVYHYSDEHMRQYLEKNDFGVVGIGLIAGYWQYRQLKRMIRVIDQLKNRPVIVLGGFMFTPDPAFFMRKFQVDFVVLGEGEKSFTELIRRIADHRGTDDIPGLASWNGGQIRITQRQAPIQHLDDIPFPAWDKFPINAYVPKVRIPAGRAQRSLPVISSRGCLYKCAFCYRMEKGYRKRSLDSIMEECKHLISTYHINSICFRDELLMSTADRAMEFAERIIKENLNIHFDIDGRLNAVSPDALKLLKKAGCVYINYGVESLDNRVLKNMNKRQTTDEIVRGVELTIQTGIHPGLNVIFGNVGDNRDNAFKVVEFLKKYNTYGELRTLKPVTPYPGSDLYYLALEKGLIKDCEDFYENKHLNSDRLSCNFTNMSGEEFYNVMLEANTILIKDHFEHISNMHIEAHRKLYMDGDINFRGVRS